MCGIVGFYTNNKSLLGAHAKKASLVELVIADTVRGYDSTGLFAVDKDKNTSIFKDTAPGWDFIERKRTRNIIQNLDDYRAVVFHNRFATVGNVTTKNAHPFEFDNVVGVHNGTLYAHGHLCKDFHQVDSQSLLAGISENGVIPTLKKAEGAIAMVFYDKARKKFCVYRNSERPLAYARLKDDPTFFYASEMDMLKWVLARNKLEYSIISEVPEHILFEMDIDDHEKITQTRVQYERPLPQKYDARDAWDRGEERGWTKKQAGFVPIVGDTTNTESRSILSIRKDIAGYQIGQKILVEIVDVRSGTGGRYNAEGCIMGYDFADVRIQSITEADYQVMRPFLKKGDSFLVYVNIMAINAAWDPKMKWLLVSPYKPVSHYAKKKVQDQIMRNVVNGKFEGVEEKKIVTPTPEEVLRLAPSTSTGTETPRLLTSRVKESDETKNSDNRFVKGPGGNLITQKEFDEAVKAGCPCCGHPIVPKDDIDWHAFTDPAHSACATKWDLEQNNIRKDKLKNLH